LSQFLGYRLLSDGRLVIVPTEEKEDLDTLTAWGKTILHSVFEGKINPEQGKVLMTLIESQIKTVELAALSQRIAVVEKGTG